MSDEVVDQQPQCQSEAFVLYYDIKPAEILIREDDFCEGYRSSMDLVIARKGGKFICFEGDTAGYSGRSWEGSEDDWRGDLNKTYVVEECATPSEVGKWLLERSGEAGSTEHFEAFVKFVELIESGK